MELSLEILSGVNTGTTFRFALDEGEVIRIGRDRTNTLVLRSPTVSRFHAEIQARERKLFLVDRESTQGTWLMGFRLSPGKPEQIAGGEEFKAGSELFRLDYKESGSQSRVTPLKRLPSRSARGAVIGCLVVLLLMMLLAPNGRTPARSNTGAEVRNMPGLRVERTAEGGVSIPLPVSDIAIQFEVDTPVPLALSVDDTPLSRIAPTAGGARAQLAIVRDTLSGHERRLTIQPAVKGRGAWTVDRIWISPINPEPERDAAGLSQSIAVLMDEAINISGHPSGWFEFSHSLQQALVKALISQNLAAIEIPLSAEGEAIEPIQIRSVLESISRSGSGSSIEQLQDLLRDTESELWRRYFNRLKNARLAAQVHNYRDAILEFRALQGMFPDLSEGRRVAIEENMKKSLPKRVFLDPDRYLRR